MSKPEETKTKVASANKGRPLTFILAAVCVLIAVAAVATAIRYRPKRGAEPTAVPTASATAVPTTAAPTTATDRDPAEKTTNGEDAATTLASPKGYAIFVDPTLFRSTVEGDKTTITGLDEGGAVMTVEPVAMAYDEACAALEAELGAGKSLTIAHPNAGFGNDADKPTNVAYCIDDGQGGCIIARYVVPADADVYRDEFEIALGMIRVGN